MATWPIPAPRRERLRAAVRFLIEYSKILCMALAAGDKLGPYEILAPIGAGGMGEVYRARDSRLGREVAVKILPGHLANNQQALARFEREGKAVAALSHPNILVLFDVGEHEGVHYVVTELLEGETLRDRLSRSPLSWRKTIELGVALAEGLAAAHGKDIVHRDIKPGNIFLTTDGQVKILDFGLARFRPSSQSKPSSEDETLTMGETQAGAVMGTVGYMSPEQVRGETAGAPSDIFSLGCVLFEALTGRQPFTGKSAADTMAAILKEDHPAIADTAKQVPAELERVIDRCLAKNPTQRFHSAHDLAFALKGLLSAAGDKPIAAAEPRRARLGVVLAMAAAVVIVAATGLYYWRSHAARGINSLAVLPFANMSGNSDTDYLSDGITESLMDSLSELPNLKVMSRSAVSRYKGKEPDVPSVGRDLGVRAVLTGRITQRGDNLTVSAELVDAADNSRLWGEQYNRKLADALAVQNDIAHQIVEKLRLRLSDTQATHMVTRQTANPEAYQLYLKGRYFAAQFSPEGLDKGMNYFKQAIALDPNYALAYDGISYYYDLIEDITAAPAEVMPKAEEAARKAIQLDDSLVEPHVEQAYNYTCFDFDWPAAEREFQRAISLNPNYAGAHEDYAWYLISQGRADQAVQEGQRAVELDPLSAEIHSILGWVSHFAHRYEAAAVELRKSLELDPDYWVAYYQLGQVYAQQGKIDDAMAAQRKASDLFGSASWPLAEIARDYVLAGKLPEARQALRDLLARSQHSHVAPYGIATVYAALGEKDQAFAQLEQAYTQRSFFMDWLKVDPELDSLRSDPRFQDLLGRMNLR
jgi:eukaryotic-like serine/threonine-protein kinase